MSKKDHGGHDLGSYGINMVLGIIGDPAFLCPGKLCGGFTLESAGAEVGDLVSASNIDAKRQTKRRQYDVEMMHF